MKFRRLVGPAVVVVMAVFLCACGGGGGGGGDTAAAPIDTGGDPGDTGGDGTTTPLFSGFDFELVEGDFLEYGWDYKSQYTAASGSSSSSYSGTFRVTLGPILTVDNIDYHEMLISGTTDAGDRKHMRPRGAYIALSDNKILVLDSDRTTVHTLFDAQTGLWPGRGFFATLPESTLFSANNSTLSNDYLNEPAYMVRESQSASQCEYFPGIGTICGGDYNEDMDEREYYIEGVGPAGYYAYYSISDPSSSDGGWWASNTTHIGLTASSLRGNTVDYTLEIEPNNKISEATPITLPAKVRGNNVSETYLGGTTAVSVGLSSVNENEPNDSPFAPQALTIPSSISADALNGDAFTSVSVTPTPTAAAYTATFEDWYEVTMVTGNTMNFTLDFTGPNTDLDMYLFSIANQTTVDILSNSVDNNISSGIYKEEMSKYLTAGTYYVAVDAYTTSNGRADYTLTVSSGDSSVDICDWFSFSLASQAQVSITVTGGPSFVLVDAAGTNTLANGDAAGTSMILSAGSYLIGVSQNGPYTLEVSSP